MHDRRRHRITGWAVACLYCLTTTGATAQTQTPPIPAGPLTLEQVLELAEPRSQTVAIARAGVSRADGERVRARSGLFPQLSAAVAYDRTLASEFDGVFDNQDLFGGDGAGTGTTPAGDEDNGLQDLPFGQKNVWRMTFSFSQNLYSGGRIGAQAAIAEAGRETAELVLTGARAQLLFDVTQAYYDAALSERLVTIAEATVQQAGATLQQTQAGFDAGTQPEFEVLRARVARDNQTPLLIRQRVNRDIALLRLKQLLELPADSDIRLADALGDEALPPPPVFAARVAVVERAMPATDRAAFTLQANATMPDRLPITEAAAAVRLREASLRLTEAERRPSVALNSTYGRVGYRSFPSLGRTNWTVGASLNLPLLTGGRQRGDELVSRAEFEQAQAQLQQVEELATLDTRAAWAELLAARAAWEASAGTVQQAGRAYEIADVRYRAGVSTQLELSDSRLLLQQAEANRAQAARDLQVARAHVALLPNLPVGAGGVGSGGVPRSPQQAPSVQPSQPAQGGGQLRNAAAQGAPAQTGTR